MNSALIRDDLHLLGLGGSNKVLAGELSRIVRRACTEERSRQLLSRPPRKVGPGGIVLPFAADLAALAVTYHRTSARVLWDIASSPATRLERLFDDLKEAFLRDERAWLRDGASFTVLPFATHSVQAGERQVVGVVKNALLEAAEERGLRLRLDPERPDLSIHARSFPQDDDHDSLVISIDLAGMPMHRRGYRTLSGQAPLREDLAANLVMLSRFDARSEVFIDPMAGSGTLGIEAALMASGRPVWMSGRKPAAEHIEPIQSALTEIGSPLFGDTQARIFAAESDPEAFATLERSTQTAGTAVQTTMFQGYFQNWDLARVHRENERGVILSNPPYGARLGADVSELARLYRDLGNWCRQFPGYRAGFIVGEPESDREQRRGPSIVGLFQDEFGGRPRIKKPLRNGPLSAQFLLYDL